MIKKIPEACLLDLKIDSNKILEEIENCQDIILANGEITGRGKVHKSTKAFWIQGRKNDQQKYNDYLNEIPTLKKIIEQIPGKSHRILIADMEPKGDIPRHIDKGKYFENKLRFHIPLKTNNEVYFFVSTKTYNMKENEIWYIDNSSSHAVKNNSEKNRIHLIFDIEINNEVINFVKSGNFNLGKKQN